MGLPLQVLGVEKILKKFILGAKIPKISTYQSIHKSSRITLNGGYAHIHNLISFLKPHK